MFRATVRPLASIISKHVTGVIQHWPRWMLAMMVLVAGAGTSAWSAEGEAKWGDAVEGVQVRLQTVKAKWKEGEKPQLAAEVRNHGQRNLEIQTRQTHGWDLEVDGLWYQRPSNTRETRALPSPFQPGRVYVNIKISVDGIWELVPPKEPNKPRQKATERLALPPGKYFIRVAVTAQPGKNEGGNSVRALSNTVELEIVSKPE